MSDKMDEKLTELINKSLRGNLAYLDCKGCSANLTAALININALHHRLNKLNMDLAEVRPDRCTLADSLTHRWTGEDGYQGKSIPREIMHARFLEHHAKARIAEDYGVISELLQGAAAEIRELFKRNQKLNKSDVDSFKDGEQLVYSKTTCWDCGCEWNPKIPKGSEPLNVVACAFCGAPNIPGAYKQRPWRKVGS